MENLTVNKPSGADAESAHVNTLVCKQATGNTIIFAGVKIKQTKTNKQPNQTNPAICFFFRFVFSKRPQCGTPDNHVICRFNWKCKSRHARHYAWLWCTPCRLTRDGASKKREGHLVSLFKYHSTPGRLIGARAERAARAFRPVKLPPQLCPSLRRLNWLHFYLFINISNIPLSCGHFFPFDKTKPES